MQTDSTTEQPIGDFLAEMTSKLRGIRVSRQEAGVKEAQIKLRKIKQPPRRRIVRAK